MAIIFADKSVCPLCGDVIMQNQDAAGLPATPQTQHDLYRYFDCGFHSSCFDNWERKQEALSMAKEDIEKYKNSDEYKAFVIKYGRPQKPG